MRRLAIASLALVAACGGSSGPGTNTDCPSPYQKIEGICLLPPGGEAQRTSCGDVSEFCDKAQQKAPALACLTGGPRQLPPTPAKVTLTGFVHPFSSGKSNSPATIQIFRAADLADGKAITAAPPVVPPVTITFDPAKATDPKQLRACDVEPRVGCVPVSLDACKTPVCADGLGGRNDDGKYCHVVAGSPSCDDRLRWEPRFSIPGVPTNTPLVIRTSGKSGQADQTWSVLVQFNVFLATDDKPCADDQAVDCLDQSDPANPRYQLNVNVLSQSDYTAIPVTAGLSGGISSGLGAIAGEIRDCDNVRVANAQVGVSPSGERFTYFNGNPYNTLPDSGRAGIGTDRLGLFAALNIAPGKVSVVAVGNVGGKQTVLGRTTAFVYADAVSVVNLNGGKPQP